MDNNDLKDKFKRLSDDIDGYVGNVLYEENSMTTDELKQEMVCICEYMKAICDLMSKGNIESDYLGVAEVVNKMGYPKSK